MDLNLIMKLSVCVSLLVLCSTNVHGQTIFEVTDFGAIADGETDNSEAFLTTWAKACATSGGGVLVPAGTFVIKTAAFEGQCVGETSFQLIGDVVATNDPTLPNEYWIQFSKIDGLKLYGAGTFNGQGDVAWPKNDCSDSSSCSLPPVSIKISNLKSSEISDIKSLNSKGFHIHMAGSDSVVVQNVQITAPASSPNTDGIHISTSNNITIIQSNIATGDDCISLGDGNTNINITGVNCGPGHGISIGSLGKYDDEQDVSGITVTNCNFTKTDNGLRIKTWAPSVKPITVSDVTFSNINLDDVENPIIIDQYYCPHCTSDGESSITIQDVKFINIKGTSATNVSVNLQCSKLKPCQGIELSGLDLKMSGSLEPTSATCSNAQTTFDETGQVPANC